MENDVNSPPLKQKKMVTQLLTPQEEKRLEELNILISKYQPLLEELIKERRLLIYKVEKR